MRFIPGALLNAMKSSFIKNQMSNGAEHDLFVGTNIRSIKYGWHQSDAELNTPSLDRLRTNSVRTQAILKSITNDAPDTDIDSAKSPSELTRRCEARDCLLEWFHGAKCRTPPDQDGNGQR